MLPGFVIALMGMALVATGCGGGDDDDDTPTPQPRTSEAVAERVNALTAALVDRDYAEVCAQLAPKAVEGLIRAAAEEGTDTDECSDAAAALYGDLPDADSSDAPEVTASDVTLEQSGPAVVGSPSPGGGTMELVYAGGSWLALTPFFVR